MFERYPREMLERFKKYHRENPRIYEEFKRLAFEMKKTGRTRYSAETIINVIRWHSDIATSGDVFEINNDFKPIYVRLLIYHYPEFLDFFELRKVTSRGHKSEEQRNREDATCQ